MATARFSNKDFSKALLRWASRHGRRHLPWQRAVTPYRIWVSEVMLQQTQVATASDYFARFVNKFPSVRALAKADLDEVLTLWAGLGYYSRARNLHKAACLMCDRHGSKVPNDLQALQKLPGIGRSTAGAVFAIGFSGDAAILDGNVKRILARYFAVEGYVGETAVAKTLWRHAESLTPAGRAGDYAQAIMDLGALLCTKKAPACVKCPVRRGCLAFSQGRQMQLPSPKPKRPRPVRKAFVLLLQSNKGIALERRPPKGIWGGLWSLPEMQSSQGWPLWFKSGSHRSELLEVIYHDFTHFRLQLVPVSVRVSRPAPRIPSDMMWYRPRHAVGMPAPIKKLLHKLLQ